MARAVLGISAGTAIAQIIVVLSAPVISRIYAPSTFGTYAVIVSVAAIITGFAALRWDFAIPLPKEESDAQANTSLGLLSTLVVTVASTVGILIWSAVTGHSPLLPWLLLAPLIGGSQAAMKVLNQLAVRHRRYRAIATRAVVRSAAIVLESDRPRPRGAEGRRSGDRPGDRQRPGRAQPRAGVPPVVTRGQARPRPAGSSARTRGDTASSPWSWLRRERSTPSAASCPRC